MNIQHCFAFFSFLFLFFWLHHEACRILVPQPGIEPVPPEVEAQSLNPWTMGEVPEMVFKYN